MQTEVIPLELHRLHGSVLKTLFLFFYSTKKKKKQKQKFLIKATALIASILAMDLTFQYAAFAFQTAQVIATRGRGTILSNTATPANILAHFRVMIMIP